LELFKNERLRRDVSLKAMKNLIYTTGMRLQTES